MKPTTRTVPVAFMALVLAGASTIAHAGEPSVRFGYDEKQEVIQLVNLNLSNPSDARHAVAMIQDAAHSVCERKGSSIRLPQGRDLARCIKSTYARTLAEINTRFSVNLEAIAAHGGAGAEVAATSR